MKIYVHLVVDVEERSIVAYARVLKQDVFDGIWIVDIIDPILHEFDKVSFALSTNVSNVKDLGQSYEFRFSNAHTIINPSDNDTLEVAKQYKREVEKLLEKLAAIHRIKTVHDLYELAKSGKKE